MGETPSPSKKFVKDLWTVFCILLTTYLMVWQILLYLEDKDTSTISFKIFHEDEQDIYPSIGFCFSPVTIDEKLNQYGIKDPSGSNWSGNSLSEYYNRFLTGMYGIWNPDLLLSLIHI